MVTTQLTRPKPDSDDPVALARAALLALQEDYDAPADEGWLTRLGLSLEAFLTLPEVKPSLEYEEGRVTQKVSPKIQHGAPPIRADDAV